jgi:hypothetical protein
MVHHDMFGMAWCPKLYWGEQYDGDVCGGSCADEGSDR